MIVEGSAMLGTIINAMMAVYTAYSTIKSNKDRCKQLVDRCELISNRLQAILATEHDTRIVDRLGDLEKAFAKTADTIEEVGKQGYIVSLLRTEENAALIEDAQRALTELITTLSLETIIDIASWQKENEQFARRQFQQVKQEIRRLDQNFSGELAGHGATIEQLIRVVEKMAKKLGEPITPLREVPPELPPKQAQPRMRSWSSPSAVRPAVASMLDQSLAPDAPELGYHISRKGSPGLSSSSRIKPSLPTPSYSAGCEPRRRTPIPLIAPSPLVQSHMTQEPSPTDDVAVSDFEIPDDPPPPYTALSWEDEVSAAYDRMEPNILGPDAPATSRTSTQAIRTAISPGATSQGRPLTDDLLVRVRQYLKRKEIKNFSVMKTIGQFGKINTRILVEMLLFPKNRTADAAISLDSFEPTQRDKLQLVKSRAHQDKEDVDQTAACDLPRPEFNHVLLLCPREAQPSVVVIGRKQPLPQQVVKAYILDTAEPLTLVSVIRADKKSWLLIPYHPEMTIRKAKEYIQRHFRNSSALSCCVPGQNKQLSDNSTLLQNGVQAYDHCLSMTATWS